MGAYRASGDLDCSSRVDTVVEMSASRGWRDLALAAVLAAGCGGGPTPAIDGGSDPDMRPDMQIPPSCVFTPPPAPTGGTIELGAVDPPELNNFTQVSENGNFQVYAGPQGGYHVWIDVRIQGMDPGDGVDVNTRPQTRFSVFAMDGSRINLEDCAYRLEYSDGGDGFRYLSIGWLNQIQNAVALTIDMTPLRLLIEVLDRDGLYAIDERWVNALAPIPTPIGP
jgi:hypothetical protein